MHYSKKILRKFLEMPAWDDSQVELGDQSQIDKDINDKRLASLSKRNKVVRKLNLRDDISIEMLENHAKSNFNVYLIETIGGSRHVIGLVDIMDNEFPYPSVQMSYVDKQFHRKGYSTLMYKTAISYLGGLVSDAKLTGEKVPGSFNVWLSLGKELFTYVIDRNGFANEVGQFDRSMMNSEETRFMVTEEEDDEEKF